MASRLDWWTRSTDFLSLSFPLSLSFSFLFLHACGSLGCWVMIYCVYKVNIAHKIKHSLHITVKVWWWFNKNVNYFIRFYYLLNDFSFGIFFPFFSTASPLLLSPLAFPPSTSTFSSEHVCNRGMFDLIMDHYSMCYVLEFIRSVKMKTPKLQKKNRMKNPKRM